MCVGMKRNVTALRCVWVRKATVRETGREVSRKCILTLSVLRVLATGPP